MTRHRKSIQVSREAVALLQESTSNYRQQVVLGEIYHNYAELIDEVYFDAIECPPEQDYVLLQVRGTAVTKCQMGTRHADARLMILDPDQEPNPDLFF